MESRVLGQDPDNTSDPIDPTKVEEPGELATMSIMVVDDDPVVIKLAHHILRDYTSLRFATNGADALRLIRAHPPDLLLLDAEMPGMSGFELCAILKEDPELRGIAIIFVTSHDDLAFEARALSLGAADFIPKPLSAVRLRLRVKLHLQLKFQVDHLRALATTDAGTGVANRRQTEAFLASEWLRARRTKSPLSFLMIDIDHFKAFNDMYGHPTGDRCLHQVAHLLRESARRKLDLVGRLGGEEFGVVLPHTNVEGALDVSQRIRTRLAEAAIPHRGSPVADHVTVSIGVSCVSGSIFETELPGDSSAMLVEPADLALYAAKRAGRNRVKVYEHPSNVTTELPNDASHPSEPCHTDDSTRSDAPP